MKLKNELSDYYFNLGELYLFQKQYQKAKENYLRGLKVDQEQNNQENLASDYNMLGQLYVQMENLTAAEAYFQQAALVSGRINAQGELADSYYNLGLLYKRLGKKNKAREFLRLAQEIYREIDLSTYQKIKQEFQNLAQ
jgi:tetratricopeptide (TPR) repeat protein